MKPEQVKSSLADSWMHVRRVTHGEVKQYSKRNEVEPDSMATRMVALCLCREDGRSPYATEEEATKAIDAMDWQLVRDIDQQAAEFNGFSISAKDAEKNS